MSFLKTTREGPIVVLTMNQPETRNALTGNTAVEEIVRACEDVQNDQSVRALILTGGGPVFCSGGNVKDMQKYAQGKFSPEEVREEYRRGIQRVPKALYNLDVPTIAAVNGPAIGAGLDLACMCDIRVASETATFAESFVRVGIVPGDGEHGCYPEPWADRRRPRWPLRAIRSMPSKHWPPGYFHRWSRPLN